LSCIQIIHKIAQAPGSKASHRRVLNSAILVAAALLLLVPEDPLHGQNHTAQTTQTRKQTAAGSSSTAANSGLNAAVLVDRYCNSCHSDDQHKGGLSLESYDLLHPEKNPEIAEKIIRKLRAGMMPPPGRSRPSDEELSSFATALEKRVDTAAAAHPYAGFTPLHRLNRIEYANSVKALLDLNVDASALLPADDMSHGFNNMADVLTVSPALLEAYIAAAGKISREAIGDPHATPTMATYTIPRVISQTRHIDGTPFGTRGGVALTHTFPADGDYVFKIAFYTHQQGYLFGQTQAKGQQLEIAIDGERVALIDVNPKFKDTDDLRTPVVHVKAGQRIVSAAFIRRFDGPIQDEVQPYEQSLIDVNVANLPGLTTLVHLRGLSIVGPSRITGISETPSRDKVFTVYPARPADETEAARTILTSLVRRAYRKPASQANVEQVLRFYRQRRTEGASFDEGIRAALEAILANPQFIFRFEKSPANVSPGHNYPIGDLELASRLAFFLWSAPPDAELLRAASAGTLHLKPVMERETRRMIADRRSATLANNFAVQWLSLKNLDDVLPDPYQFPNFDRNLAQSMRRETELLFDDVVRDDHDVLDLLTSKYTFVDERLARHYRIPNVLGDRFRRVEITDDNRRGLLGQASILTLTSTANRTALVTRGKWVMQVLLGSAPPPPPPNIPTLAEAADLTTAQSVRQRMEEHRKNPACASCHRVIDPIGFSLEKFDPTGAWRESDDGVSIDATGTLFDGTPLHGPSDLRNGILHHREAFLRTFAENLYAYGLGRVPDYRDLPEVRAIVTRAEKHGDRFSEYVLGIVESPGFTERSAPVAPSQSKPEGSSTTLKAEAASESRQHELLAAKPIRLTGGSR
jgi:mono/diheme cytochrome c family protein